MSTYLLDTNHAAAVWKGDQSLRKRMMRADEVSFVLCTPAVAELWYMVFKSEKVQSNWQRMELFLSDFVQWPFDGAAALEFGRIQVELSRKGRPIPVVDVQIAAIARVYDVTVLTADRHFDEIQSLKVENWLN